MQFFTLARLITYQHSVHPVSAILQRLINIVCNAVTQSRSCAAHNQCTSPSGLGDHFLLGIIFAAEQVAIVDSTWLVHGDRRKSINFLEILHEEELSKPYWKGKVLNCFRNKFPVTDKILQTSD